MRSQETWDAAFVYRNALQIDLPAGTLIALECPVDAWAEIWAGLPPFSSGRYGCGSKKWCQNGTLVNGSKD